MKIRSILIDDESDALEVLETLLKLYCPEVQVVDKCRNALEGLSAIQKFKPDIVFLDVEMPGGNGLKLAEQIGTGTKIIFTTAHKEYSIDAIRVSAFDYLLKPIDVDDLISTVARYRSTAPSAAKNELPSRQFIKLSDAHETVFVRPENIMYIRALGRYSEVILDTERRFILAKTIHEFEKGLPKDLFIRTHKSYLINASQIDQISSKDGGFIVLKSGKEVELSRRKKAETLKFLQSPGNYRSLH